MKQINTVCRGCIFAEYDPKSPKTQVGCKLGRIDLYRQNGRDILEAYDEENNEFFIVDGDFCLLRRTAEWGLKHDKKKWATMAREEIKLPIHAIVVASNNVVQSHVTVQSLLNQKLPPKYITIVRKYDNYVHPVEFINMMKGFNTSIPWTVQNDVEYNNNQIDRAVETNTMQYYAVLTAGSKLPKHIFNTIDYLVHDTLFKFGYIELNRHDAIVPYIIHSYYGGNKVKPLVEKLRKDNESMIFNMEDLCLNCRK